MNQDNSPKHDCCEHGHDRCEPGCHEDHSTHDLLKQAIGNGNMPVLDASKMAHGPLLTFPCEYPLKAFGRAEEGFLEHVHAIVQKHVPEVRREHFQTRPSSKGNYVSLTVVLQLTSREQLDNIYRELKEDVQVLTAL